MWFDSIRRLLGFGSRPNRCPGNSALRKWRGPRLDFERLEDRFAPAVGVFTDKLDYRPADTAIITATGFDIGSVVEFQVVHDPSTPGIPGGAGHEPWSVQDGSAQDLDGLANGTVVTSWYVNPDDSAHATFILTASGSSGGQLQTATTTFTDAPEKADLDHFANLVNGGEYVDGDLNSGKASYLEGDSVPYRIVFSNLLDTETYTITIGYDTTKSGAHAFDYFTTYNRTQASDPLAGVSGVVGATDTEPIPVDPQVTAGPDGSLVSAGDNVTQIPGVFTLFGGNITAVSAYTYSGTYAGDSSAFISVTFTVNSGGDTAVLAWSGHIATRDDWGPNSSAGAITGSPYHQYLEDFTNISGTAGTGQQDHQLQSDVVIIPATIIIVKDTVPDGATDFSFTTTGGLTPSTFSLDDDGDNGNTLSNTQTFTGIIDFDTYTFTEQAVTGFDVAIAVAGASSFGTSGRTATINVAEGETVTVTFTNTQRGSITWEKRDGSNNNALLGGATFEVRNAATNALIATVTDNGAGDTNNTAGVITVGNLPPGSYTVTETVAPTGYSLDPTPRNVTVSSDNLNAHIGTPGQNDSEDFHDFLGSITWEKRDGSNDNVLLGGATFEIRLASNNALIRTVTDNGAGDIDNTPGVITVDDIPLGSYKVIETVAPTGYALDATPRNVTVSSANLNPHIGTPGQNDASDFHNFLGSITWEKRDGSNGNVLLGGATFEVRLASNNSLVRTVTDNGAGDTNNTPGVISVDDIPLGSYTVTETVAPAGYALDPTPRNVTVSAGNLNPHIGTPGQNDTSDFHNFLGSITWEKRDGTNNNVLLGGATFEVRDVATDAVVLTVTDNGPGDTNNTAGVITVVNLPLGDYTVTEVVPPAGYSVDTTPRNVSVYPGNLNPSIGTPGQNDTNDFHDFLGGITWEKRDGSNNNVLLGGATFEIRDAATDALVKTVTDNGPGDLSNTPGVISVGGLPLGTYNVIETIAPTGYALDTDPRTITVSQGNLSPSIGTLGQNDADDFHNYQGIISWEKRREDTKALQGGATFTVTDNATNQVILTVTDNGPDDVDSTVGRFMVVRIPLGDYTVTETVSPAGFARDDDYTRLVTVSVSELNPVIGTQGQDDAGNLDESDFHNRLGTISWEKRRDDTDALLGGATFEIRDAVTDALVKTVIDNGAGDRDPDVGQITVKCIKLGDYVVIETVSPTGFALDDDPTRLVTISDDTFGGELYPVIGTHDVIDSGDSEESDFFNRLGSIEWEKRREDTSELQGGATFTITNNATGVLFLTVTDNGPGDEDPAEGRIKVINVPLASYTVTETKAPAGWGLDDDPTRIAKVCKKELYVVIGTQGEIDPGNTEESDFFNRQGSISWEKRREDTHGYLGGATFTVTDNSTNQVILTVTDDGPGDADPVPGRITVTPIPLGTYTVTEIASPAGFAIDDDPTRVVKVNGELNPVIGVQGAVDKGNTDESDFINRLGSIAWEKRRADNLALVGGATFEIRDAFTGDLIKTVTDNGPGDADPFLGRFRVKGLLLGTYLVIEINPPHTFELDDDPTRLVTIGDDRNGIDDDGDGIIDDPEELHAVIGTQGVVNEGDTDESDFFNAPKDFSKRGFLV